MIEGRNAAKQSQGWTIAPSNKLIASLDFWFGWTVVHLSNYCNFACILRHLPGRHVAPSNFSR